MGFKYLGWTVDSMLNYLNKNCDSVILRSEPDGEWILTVVSDTLGEFEKKGSLRGVVVSAFKPFIDDANKQRDKMKITILGAN